ncbi:MAG: NAD(P)-dependent oxidoreductase [Desulfosporosinus sp.]|nr:NAD(P)-dependent oxidoreductase [Desulfosporosinus sp.]
MKILVTGAGGFIGRNIVEYLSSRNHSVLSPTHHELDLMDEHSVSEYIARQSIDVIIHGAIKPAQRTVVDRSQILYHNTKMFFNIVRNSNCFNKLLFLSSGAVYDMEHYVSKMPETYFDTFVPKDEYGFSKYLSAKYIEQVKNITELRIFGVFGKYEEYAIRFISNVICKVIFDLPITIKQNRQFDYLYISDFGQILDYFIYEDAKYCAYNVTPDQAVDLYSLAEKVLDIAGKKLPIIINKPGIAMEYSGNNQRLHQEIDLVFTPLDDAIKELYSWYSTNFHLINKSLLLTDA